MQVRAWRCLRICATALHTLVSGITARFGEDFIFRHSLLNQVIARHAAFGEMRIAAAAAGGNDGGRQVAVIEFQRVVQPGLEHG